MRLTDAMIQARRLIEMRDQKSAERDPLARDPLVLAALDHFPGAEVVKVNRRSDGSSHLLTDKGKSA